jgi:15-cis-phytoene synthase/lycopene beta-cyclase
MVSATPWDSYLIRNNIWTYPEDAIVGPTLFKIPIEEIFFFFIQTYNSSLIYSILTKRLVLPCYLRTTATKISEIVGTIVISCGVLYGIGGFWVGGKHTYMSLILGWLCPLMLIPWYEFVASRFGGYQGPNMSDKFPGFFRRDLFSPCHERR